ncbi:MAG: phenylacetate--CoA ligase family protein [Clostridia bacterium]
MLNKLENTFTYAKTNSPFYRAHFKDIDGVRSMADFHALPFSDKADLRAAYPLGLLSVPRQKAVRIHSSSGTTGMPVIIPYTQRDVDDWAKMFMRCYQTAGITDEDVIQITPGYGLWTAGIGFQLGAERLGAMTVPMGPGNTEKQLQMLVDLQSTVLASTSSYALLLAEEVQKRGLADKIALKKGVIGSERWGDRMRDRIQKELGIQLFDIYGLTEVYGPGIAIDCPAHEGMHYWNDYLYFEIIDSVTGQVLPDGEWGELVITTLCKEAAPLVRYRTHDLTRIIPHACSCGSPYPMIDRIQGRTDDMVKAKGVNIYPSQIDSALTLLEGASSEYQLRIDRVGGKDQIKLLIERAQDADPVALQQAAARLIKAKIGLAMEIEIVDLGALPRSEKKTARVYDYREK